MTDLVLNAICAVLLIFITATVVICMFQCTDRRLARAYFMVGSCVSGWLFSVILYRITSNETLALYFDNLALAFISFLPVMLLMLIAFFYKQGKCITKKLKIILCIIPFCTTLVVLIPQLNFLIRYVHKIVSIAPLHVATYAWNWWFYVHLIYSYIITMTSVVIVVTQHNKQPSGYALPSGLIVISICLTIIGNLIALVSKLEIDMTMITSCISIVLLYIAIANNPGTEYLTIARNELFDSMENAVFVMNSKRQVVATNAAALNWLKLIGFNNELSYEFEEILSHLSENGATIKENPVHHAGKSVYLRSGDNLVVYTLAEQYVADKKGRMMGSYVSLTDITYYSQMIARFEQDAEIDALTKIPNRRAYERQCIEMDTKGNLPLSIMIADVNGLKQVNDQLGHQYGDELLCLVAKIITRICPERAVAARIGGDEFALIAPCCGSKDIKALIDEAKKIFCQEKNELYLPSVAMGVATKTNVEQDLQVLIREADKAMYRQKEYDRRNQN